VFTQEHYTSKDWEDISKRPVNLSDDSYEITGDAQLYQQWEANTFTVTFNSNGKILTTNLTSISGVDEALSAEGGLKKALKDLPAVEEVIVDGIVYEFMNWADTTDGSGGIIDASTSLFPKSATEISNKEVTLYAQWRVKGAAQYRFNYTGQMQTWKVITTGVYKIEAWGAGGNGGGLGGYIGGNIELNAEQDLYIYVGGQGKQLQVNVGDVQQAGGWNGGGDSGGTYGNFGFMTGGGGHGAADVRTVSGDWNNTASLESRIIVAGGGGGQGSGGSSGSGGLGLAAGGAGVKDAATAGGGKLTGGGISNPTDPARLEHGALGKGGHGGRQTRGGGGGGGGYYGGGGGTRPSSGDYNYPSGGGGGSSWAQTGETATLKFTGIVPQTPVTGGGTNNGPGTVLITFVPAVEGNVE
jgi:hypothetical protein